MESNKPTPGPLLAKINSPADLKKLDADQLQDVCDELRQYIIDIVSVHGGHFGASLGVVELTTALHYVYDTPKDLVVWDVGHQAYGHKILTGRRDEFHTNRQYGGISGFPKRSESEYDTFGVGHSSTSISAALGMAVARDLDQSDKKVVAVIGDGAMTAGLAFEAMNNAGAMNSDILVILNDNNMSIDPNVGALKEYLAEITTSKTFNKMRDEIYDMLGHFKSAGEKMRKAASRLENAMTAALTPGSLFRALGFKYYGPTDGHDVDGLRHMLEDLKEVKGPKLLHIVTVKGKGFSPAEREQTKWHASSSPFDKITGKSLSAPIKSKQAPKYQDVFGDALVELAEKDERIVSMTPAMPSGSSLWPMMNAFPERAFDVGIAEQHAVTFAAGLAAEGKKAFCAIYSSFLQRGYDQLVHDVAIQKLPVVFCIDRAGLVGADGPTHHGAYDIAYMRAIPNMVISSPLNEQDLRDMMYSASKYDEAAWAIRYPRGRGTGMETSDFKPMEIGKGVQLKEGEDVAVLSLGPLGNYVTEAANRLSKEGIEIGHFDMRFVKPLDTELIDQICREYDHIITLEDGAKMGGFGSAVAEYISEKAERPTLKIMGIPDRIVEHGTQEELYDEIGIGISGIMETVKTANPNKGVVLNKFFMLVLLLLSVTVTGCFNQDTIPVYNNVDGQVLENGEPVFGARIHFRNNYDPGGFTQQAIGDSVSISFRTNIQDVYEAGLFRYSADSSFVIFFKDTLEAGQHNIQIPDSLMSNGVYGYEVFSETRYLGASLFLVNKPDSALIGTYPLTTTNFEGNFSLDAQKMALGQRFNFSDGNRFQITDSIQIIVEKDRQIRAIKSVKVKPDAENFFEITLD